MTDFTRFLSEQAKRRQPSPLKEAFVHFGNPKIASLGGGLPDPSLFPFEKVSATALAPPFAEGIQVPIMDAKDTLTVEVFKNSKNKDIELSTSLQYGQSHGDHRLRAFVKEHTDRVHKIANNDWELMLTCGNTFALDAVLRTTINDGEPVLVEEFTFSSALETIRANGAKPVGVKMDLEGIIPEELETTMANWEGTKPKFLYTIPTGQNPTGSTLSKERRQAIYKIAHKYDFLIVEDEPYYYLQMPKYAAGVQHPSLDSDAMIKSLVPSFLTYDTDGRVIRIDTFSKVLAPGTRVGWIIAHKVLAERILRLLETSSQVPSGFSQSLVNGLLVRYGQDGYLEWLNKLREVYTKSRDLACETIESAFPKGTYKFEAPTSGMFFWIKIDARKHKQYKELGGDAQKIELAMYEKGLEYGVLLVPGHWFYAPPEIVQHETEEDKNAMFFRGTLASADLKTGIERWGKLMKDYLE